MSSQAAASPAGADGAREAQLEMVGAVLAGEGLAGVAEVAAAHVGAPVAVLVPRVGNSVPGWAHFEDYVAAQLAGAAARAPAGVFRELPIAIGEERFGAVLTYGPTSASGDDYLHAAAAAALCEVAAAAARQDAEDSLRGALLEQLRARDDLEPEEITRRAGRLGCDLSGGAVALCADLEGRAPGSVLAMIGAEAPGALAQEIEGRVYALLPGSVESARRIATRLERSTPTAISSHYVEPSCMRRALEEAELVLEVTVRGGGLPAQGVADGTYRLLFRALASHPEELRAFYEDTIAALVRYDDEYTTDFVGTLEQFLEHDCNVTATARAVYAHRHTVAYRLERVQELTGLSPYTSEDRERLGLGLKAYRVIGPRGRVPRAT